MELELQPLQLPGIEDKRPLIIPGPCSAESDAKELNTASHLSSKGIGIFRAWLCKPRT